MMKDRFNRFRRFFSENAFWKKLSRYAGQAGIKTVYAALLLYYAYGRKETPLWVKNIILGILGYFLAPIDAIPDLTPILGYTDDMGILGFGLVSLATYINDDVKVKARKRLKRWFGTFDPEDLKPVDERL